MRDSFEIRALASFPQMFIWIHDKYSSTSSKQRLWQRKIVLIWKKLIFEILCVTVVQWSRSFLYVQINPVRLPATLLSVSLYRLFSLFGLFFFLHYFSFWPFFLYSYCRPCWSCTWINIYVKLKSGVLFWKRDFKSSWSAYWPSLRPRKKHKLSRHVPPLKQLNFFQC